MKMCLQSYGSGRRNRGKWDEWKTEAMARQRNPNGRTDECRFNPLPSVATSSIFYQTICGLFCIVHGCDTSGILSRNRGEFASHFAMRYRLVQTLIVHLPLIICLRACKMTAFSNCSDTCTLHATYVQYKFFWWVSLGYSKTRCLNSEVKYYSK